LRILAKPCQKSIFSIFLHLFLHLFCISPVTLIKS
jgi:hypothetical protein